MVVILIVLGGVAWLGVSVLQNGLAFHTAYRGPGTISRPYRQATSDQFRPYRGAYVHIDATDTTDRYANKSMTPNAAYKVAEAAGGTAQIQDIVVDRADNSVYTFSYDGRTYHLQSSRNGHIAFGIGLLILIGLIVAALIVVQVRGGIRPVRRGPPPPERKTWEAHFASDR